MFGVVTTSGLKIVGDHHAETMSVFGVVESLSMFENNTNTFSVIMVRSALIPIILALSKPLVVYSG